MVRQRLQAEVMQRQQVIHRDALLARMLHQLAREVDRNPARPFGNTLRHTGNTLLEFLWISEAFTCEQRTRSKPAWPNPVKRLSGFALQDSTADDHDWGLPGSNRGRL
jgi:hypothetical protein